MLIILKKLMLIFVRMGIFGIRVKVEIFFFKIKRVWDGIKIRSKVGGFLGV